MNRPYFGKVLLCLIIVTLGLIAYNSATSDLPEKNESVPVVAEVIETPTVVLPTALVSTATPPKGPSTATPTLTVRPSATPTSLSTPTPSPQIYIVEEFDTLLSIAIEFDTTVEALTTANGLNENDFLQIGQELTIPAPGEEIASSTTTGQTEAFANLFEPAVDMGTQTVGTQTVGTQTVGTQTVGTQTTVTQTVGTQTTVTQTATNNDEITTLKADAESEPAEAVVVGMGSAAEVVPSAPAALPVSVSVSGEAPPPVVSRAANINPLTGLPVDDPVKLQRRPLLIRVGNDAAARQSQAGLNSADVVYEEITEWWVTRFTAIFLSNTPEVVAPIRSARLINVQLAPQYQGALAHSGGSDLVRWEISQAPLVNLDEFYNAYPYFYRPNEGWQTRLGVNTVTARDYMVSKGSEAPVALNGFLFSDSIIEGEPGEHVFIPYPRTTSRTEWHYDAASGKYLRWTTENPLYDVGTGAQVAASNVIIYFAEHQETDIVEDSNGATSIRIIVNGKGTAWFFRNGKLNKGFWQTDGTRTPYFGYEDGRPYALKPGNTWVEVVPLYFTIGLNSPDEASSRP